MLQNRIRGRKKGESNLNKHVQWCFCFIFYGMGWSVVDSIQSAYQKILKIYNSAFSAGKKRFFGISHHGIYSSNVQVKL